MCSWYWVVRRRQGVEVKWGLCEVVKVYVKACVELVFKRCQKKGVVRME